MDKEKHSQDTRLIEKNNLIEIFPPWYLENIKNFSYLEKVSEHYTCAICLDILDDPLEELNCGNMFCKSCCISLHVCPICRANIEHFYPSPKSTANYLNDLKIKCTLCEMNLLKGGFGKHLYECSNVKIYCICGENVARINEPNHILTCSAKVDCAGKSLGCLIVLRPNEINDHEKICIYVISSQYQLRCKELENENQQLREQIKSLTNQSQLDYKELENVNQKLIGQIKSLTIQTRGIPSVKKRIC